MAERSTVSILQACEIAGVSRRTIYNWIAAKKVEYLRTAGGSIRILTDTLFRNDTGGPVEKEVLQSLLDIRLKADDCREEEET